MSPETGLEVSLAHLIRLTDDTGVFEHAHGLEPDPGRGYTADDAARALIVSVRSDEPGAARLTQVCLSFLDRAIDDNGRLRNRYSHAAGWHGPWSADAHGRTIWGLSVAARGSPHPESAESAWALLRRLAPLRDSSLRPWVYLGLGSAVLVGGGCRFGVASHLAGSAAESLPPLPVAGWIWPERRLTYDNARVAECHLRLGQALRSADLVLSGLRLLNWLVGVEWAGTHFSFTPTSGRGPRDRFPAFDQQPLEATAMVDACLAAWAVTGASVWMDRAMAAAAWFGGQNDNGMALYDAKTGAGHDGLTAGGVNSNCGAESTISAIWALQSLQQAQPSPNVVAQGARR